LETETRHVLITVDANDRRPIYLQVADEIKALIVREVLPPGAALPPVRQLATDLGVNLNTVAVAYRALRDEGLISIRHGSGAVVEVRPAKATTKAKDLRRTLGAVLTEMVLSGMRRAEIMDVVSDELRNLQKGVR
jgi:DNA-binding transcriptional regulator YhcF (GntR family)